MEISTASAVSLYNYQAAVNGGGQSATVSRSAPNSAVLDALASAYTASAGSSSLAPLVGGIYSATLANGGTSLPFGGKSSTSTSTMFSGGESAGLNGNSSAAISLNSAMALTAYSAKQTAADTGTSGANPTSPSALETAIRSAQSTLYSNSLNLLA